MKSRKESELTSRWNSDVLSFKRYSRANKSSVSTSVSKRILRGFPSTIFTQAPDKMINTKATQNIIENILWSIYKSGQKHEKACKEES